jgi:hypothetical protein
MSLSKPTIKQREYMFLPSVSKPTRSVYLRAQVTEGRRDQIKLHIFGFTDSVPTGAS